MKKHCNRKPIDPMACIRRRTPLADDQQRDISLAYRVSFQALLTGRGTHQSWATLSCSLNVALMLAEGGNRQDAVQDITRAQEAMLRSRDRAERTGKWALDGEGIQQVKRALAIHDDQIEQSTRKAIIAALQTLRDRLKTGKVYA